MEVELGKRRGGLMNNDLMINEKMAAGVSDCLGWAGSIGHVGFDVALALALGWV